jgi:hypothetical protein
MSRNDLREKLAALAHEEWAHWAEHELDTLEEEQDNTWVKWEEPDQIETLPSTKRWRRQIETPYAELSSAKKNKHRKTADKILKVINDAEVTRLRGVAQNLEGALRNMTPPTLIDPKTGDPLTPEATAALTGAKIEGR